MGSCFTTPPIDSKQSNGTKETVLEQGPSQDTVEPAAQTPQKETVLEQGPSQDTAGAPQKGHDTAASSSSSNPQPAGKDKEITSAAMSVTPVAASSSGAASSTTGQAAVAQTSSIAQRRGFKPESLGDGKDLKIDTRREKNTKKERRKIKVVDSIFDYYKLGDEVMPSSHSGMSVLFAQRLKDGLEVVIKVRDKSNSFCEKAEENEWRDCTEFMLNIPETEGIAQLYEVVEDKRGYYVVMEKVQGQDLFETMTGKGLLPVAEVKEVLRQLLKALADLHSRNLIHKDLKLENVMFDRTPPPNAKVDWDTFDSGQRSPVQVKLIDFDTVEHARPDTPKKKAKDVLGTDQYIAQEAYAGNYSAASDIFAAGVIGYRLLTSKFPFKSDIFDDEAGDNWVGSPKMNEIRDKLRKYKINWDHRVFKLEPQAKDLLSAMLAVSGSKRPTAKAALQHPWLSLVGRRKSLPAIDLDTNPSSEKERAISDPEHGEDDKICKCDSEILPHCVNNNSSRPAKEAPS